MRADLLLENVTLLDNAARTNEPGYGFIALCDGRIAAVGPMRERAAIEASVCHDGGGRLAVPGLRNLHCHAAMTLFRGLADDLDLMSWLTGYIFPAEANHVTEEMVYWCSLLAAGEMLLSGTTMVADAYFFPGAAARAFADAGIRAIAAHAVLDFPTPDIKDPAKSLDAAASFIDAWQQHPTVQPALFAHSPYTCSKETLVRSKQLALDHQVPFFIHAAETSNELLQIHAPKADSPIRHLDRLGILDDQTILVHCVWCDQADLDILASRRCKVVHCPQSNCKLASGIAPLGSMLARSIPVALGTDGPASNNSLDLFREMDLCAKLQKVISHDPVAVPANRIYRMAHRGLPGLFGGETGEPLAVGDIADLLLIELDRPHLQPFFGEDLLVYSGSGAAVHTVYAAGRRVVEARRILTFDLASVMDRVSRLAVPVQSAR